MNRAKTKLIVGLYTLVAFLWIVVSDVLLAIVEPGAYQFAEMSLIKGLLYVLATAGLLTLLLVRIGRAEERRFRAFFDRNAAAMVLFEPGTGSVWDLNPAAEGLFAISGPSTGDKVEKTLAARGVTLTLTQSGHAATIAGLIGGRAVEQDALVVSTPVFQGRRALQSAVIVNSQIMGPLAELFGYAPGEPHGRPMTDFIRPADHSLALASMRDRMVGDVSEAQYSAVGVTKDGRELLLGVHGRVAEINGERVIIGVLQDITAQKEAEQDARRYMAQLETMLQDTASAIARIAEMRDPYTSGHENRVGDLSAAIAAEMGLDESVQRGLRIAGSLHDLGKIAIPAEILTKPGKISVEEYRVIQRHPALGYQVLSPIKFPWPVADVAHQHHEKLDGSGYPQGLKGDAICLEARIVAVADVVEALSSHRPYRPSLGLEAALAEIRTNRGRYYDPAVVDACLRLVVDKNYPLLDGLRKAG